ncbi:MAG: secondary thiamine-phosphate synthase enzyme YjbQ [Marinobacter sp.]|nr:secondary thiamine-phosphate synthase enzyme YjbQ [Marinobacter sp.]
MIWDQTTIQLPALSRGFHIITNDVLSQGPDLRNCQVGLLHLFIQHTSASLAINENADPDVRGDLERHFNAMVPENAPHYRHTLEGPDDMPAHIKSVMIGPSLILPVSDGHLALGTWQGIYLCEHRDHAGGRNIVATLQGRW